MKTIFKFSILATISILMASCCNCRKASPKIGELEGVSWRLIEFQGREVNNSGIELSFDAEKKMIYGKAPCNGFFAGYSLFKNKDKNIKIANGGGTLKACPDSALEDAFTASLSSITKIQMADNKMLMLDSDGTLVAIMEMIAHISIAD